MKRAATQSPATSNAKSRSMQTRSEKVAILDAGAQYGKVRGAPAQFYSLVRTSDCMRHD